MYIYSKAFLLIALMLTLNVNAQDEAQPFNYKTTWRIVYFKGDSQFINQRPDDEYNKNQGFIQLYEILIKYVYNMQPLDAIDGHFDTKKLGIWDEIFLINDTGYQSLLIGNQTLSDGKSWAPMNGEDYEKLRSILIERSNKKDNPYDGDKIKALSSLSWKSSEDETLDDFDTHFQRLHAKNNQNTNDNPKNQTIEIERKNTEITIKDSGKNKIESIQNGNKSIANSNASTPQSEDSNKIIPYAKQTEKITNNTSNNIKNPSSVEHKKSYVNLTIIIIFISITLYYIWRIKKS